MRGWLGRFIAAAALAGCASGACAQGGIYTCTDAKGRRLTSDRPIMDCIDREQTQLSPGGKVVRKIGPSLTAEERVIEEEKQRKVLEEKARLDDEKRRDRALLSRFPDRASHDKERAIALAVVANVVEAAERRVSELQWQRKKLERELEFFKGDVKLAPVNVKRQLEENEQQLAGQKRFIANQEEEKKRINARFDEELTRLRPQWDKHAAPAPVAASARVSRASSSGAR